MLVFLLVALDLVTQSVWKYRCLSSKPENKQLAASITSLTINSDSSQGFSLVMLKLSLVLLPVLYPKGLSIFPQMLFLLCCSSQNLSPTRYRLCSFPLESHTFSFPPSLHLIFPGFAFAGLSSCLAVGSHPLSPFPCQKQQTSTCLQMRKREEVTEEKKVGVQQLYIIDMGQDGDITR